MAEDTWKSQLELNASPGSLGPVESSIPVYLDYQVAARWETILSALTKQATTF